MQKRHSNTECTRHSYLLLMKVISNVVLTSKARVCYTPKGNGIIMNCCNHFLCCWFFFFCHASDCVTDLVFHIFILIRNFTLHQILSHKVMPSIHCSLKEKWHLFLWLRWVCTNRYIQVFHMQQQSSMLPWTTENNASESFFCLCLCILFSYLYLKY